MKQNTFQDNCQDNLTQTVNHNFTKIRGKYFAIKGFIQMQYIFAYKDENEKTKENIMEFLKIIFEEYDEKFKDDDEVEYDPSSAIITKVEIKQKKGQTMKKQS